MKNAARPNLSKLVRGDRVVVRVDRNVYCATVNTRGRRWFRCTYNSIETSFYGKAFKTHRTCTMQRRDEGVMWVREWDTEQARAFMAAVALS